MKIEKIKIEKLRPYERNAKIHTAEQIEQIKRSIRQFGFNDPIGVDENDMVIEGHGRLLALKELGYKEVECIRLTGLTEDQKRAYILVHNKLTMNTGFDLELLADEIGKLGEVDLSGFDFEVDLGTQDLEAFRDKWQDQESTEEYEDFVKKFELKKTTDDCYTPAVVYEAVASFVESRYEVSRSRFVRPFYPGGDYKTERYPRDAIVVDNPPFSILSEILDFYTERGIWFFLFAPTLTLFSGGGKERRCTYIPTATGIVYENGACVNTSFITNLDQPDMLVRTEPVLQDMVDRAVEEFAAGLHKSLPKYKYPSNVITAAMVSRWSRWGVPFQLRRGEAVRVSALDAQRESGKGIFGGGFLVNDRVARTVEASERAAAAAAAENEVLGGQFFELSEREREIVARLGE